ncbi:MAG: hypothetical protein IKS83_00060, partial [Victivallales bacterium]|nr:hypothetical protein [Victivallales bacterium]
MKHTALRLFAILLCGSFTVFAQFAGLTYATASSEAVRLDLREGFGGRVVRGTVPMSVEEGTVTCDGKAVGASWDTTKLSEGWHTLACAGVSTAVCVRNNVGIVLEEGRLTENTTWDGDAVHVVRNDVYVPRGVTLTLSAGAVVKFAEESRIIVEYGGKFSVQGSEESPVLFAMAGDDAVGGDTDLREEELEPIYSARIYCYETNGWEDNGWLVSSRVVISVLPNLAVKPVRAMRQGGMVRIPVTVSGTRNTPFWVAWEAVDGTAKYGVDYASKQGKVTWSSTSAGVAYVEVPLVTDAVSDGEVSFTMRLVRACGANIQTAEAVVTIYDNAESEFDALTHATATSEAVRLDLREDFGGRVVRGNVPMYTADGTVLLDGEPLDEAWDTTTVAEGWHTLAWSGESVEVCVRNDAGIALEEGRLAENTTWDNSAVRVVRNNVYVPNGVTLTITAGTTVKFAEDSRIIVENGGKLQMNGSEDAYVQFAMATDDGYAGDTDIEDAEVILPTAARIYNYSNGTVADNGFVASRGLIISTTYPSVAIHSAVAQEESGVVWLALTLSGTRKSSFYAEWEAFDDTATYGEDYTLASGRVTWTSTDNGTRYIQIPLTAGNLSSDEETFTVRLVASGGANISTSNTATVTIRKTAEYAVNDLTYSTALAEKARLDLRDGFGGSVVRGSVGVSQEEGTVMLDGVKLGEVWDTTVCADGWYNMVCGEKSREVVVLNDVAVSLEEGRLTANTTWDGSAVHLVRNDVYVPNGVTLTLAEGAVVKFTEDTRVIVENGGKVSVQGSAEAPVQFALISDDFFGGDTDLHDGEMDMPSRNLIYCYNTSNGWTDNGYFALREVAFNTLPTIAIHNSRAVEHEGFVAIPVTVSGTRKAAFSVDWSAQDGSAKLDTDYASTSGTLTWTSTDNGTRYINIPLVERDGQQALRDFTVTLDVAYATNIGNAVSTVSVFDSAASLPADAVYACANYTFDEPADLDERTDLFSRLAREVETLRYSTEWMESEHATAVRVTSQLDEEGLTPLDLYVSEPGETDGTVDWNTYSLGTGRYLLAHETLDERGGLLERLETNFFINREVIVHEGRLTGDETWDDSVVHVVRGNVIVPAGVQLIISDGAIVKFQDGCGIVAKLGCVVECKGATFTHIADDSVGGDTNLDGLNSIPSYDAYTVGGEGTIRMDTACKLLCKSATLPSGTLNRDTRLSGNLVYRATGNLTIARGITLTIEPGAVLKFDEGQGITVNGKLEAQGTHAQPIVFTSIKDDVHGGDTNQDGTNTWPEEGDWGGVIVNGGEAVLDNIMMEWGGYGQFTNQGDAMLGCNSGSLTLDNSHLAHSMLRLVNAAGTVNISNSVLEHGRFGIDGSATVINSVLAYCGDWTLSGNGSGNVINSIFYETASSSGYSSDYSCFYNAGRQLEGVGNLAADPLFNDPNSGDFTLKATSPCIDAGDGSVAPELDYWGKPRMNYTKINDTGVAAENGCVPDIGIYEFPGTGGGEVPDLQLNWVRGPAIAASGEMVTLAWQIENAGQTTIQGTWRDTIAAVSADENLGSQIVELGITSGYEMLTPGEKKTVIRQCRIPAMMPGNWHFAVTINDNLDIYERNYLNNRQESEEGIEIQVSEWKSGKSYALASGEDIALLTTAQTILELVSQQSDGLTLRCGDGFLPTDAHFTSCARTLEDGRKLLVVPEMAGEGAFLRIANDSANGAVFGICKVSMAEAVCDVMPKALPAQVIATLSFILLDASKVKQVVLKQGDVSIAATGVSTDDQGRTVATFDLATAEAVNYDLEVTAENGMVYSVTDAVVVEETTKSAQLETWLDLPPTVRKGRQYIGYVCYKNSGNADRSAPVFRVIGKNGTQVKAKFSDKPNDVILLYGAGANPVNVLRAGQEARVPFYFSSLSDVGVD